MVQRRRCPRLSLESFQSLRVRRSVIGKELQGYVSIEPGVLGSVNHTHASATQLFLNSIMRNCLTGKGPSFRHGSVILGVLPNPSQCMQPRLLKARVAFTSSIRFLPVNELLIGRLSRIPFLGFASSNYPN